MTTKFSFMSVLEKYLLYSEAFSQYNKLEDEDKKIVDSYIYSLKKSWQQELETIKSQLCISTAAHLSGRDFL